MNQKCRSFITAFLFISIPVFVYAQPANDPCSGAITLASSTTCINTAGTLTSSSYTPPITGCGATNKTDVWYNFVAQSSNETITVSSAPGQVRLQLFSGSCAALTSVACGNTSIAATGLTIGNMYWIRVYTQNNSGGTFNICVTHAPPSNDNCAGAISLTSNTSCINTASTLNGATATAGLPAGCQPVGTHYDVWFSFVAATTSETVTISSLGANITNPRIQLYSGTCAGLTSLTCGTTTLTNAALTIGTTYYVRVANLNTNPSGSGAVADFNICVTHTGPANDLCSGAVALTPGSSCVNTSGTLVGATYTTISSIGCGTASRNDVWYSFVATSTSSTIALSSAPTNPRLQLFSGTCGSLTSLACGSSSLSTISLTIGNTYYIRVYTDPDVLTGTFNICVTNSGVANDDCSGAISLTSGNSCSNTAGTLNGSTVTTGLPVGCESAGAHYDVWYKFIAVATTETITISSLGANITSSEIQLYSGTCGSLTSLQCAASPALSITRAGLTVGATYYVRVSNVGTNPSGSGTVANFNICLTHTGVSNDLCSSAIMLTSGYSCSPTIGTVASSTVTSTAHTCAGAAPNYDVWYSFVAQSTDPTLAISQVGSNFNTSKINVELFTGSCAGSVTCLSGLTSTLTTVIGTTYFIRIYGTNSVPATNGEFSICLTDPGPPSNDACSAATTLAASSTTCTPTTGTLAYATISSPSVTSSCSGTPGADTWYSFVAQSAFPTILINNFGTSLGSGVTKYIQLLSGSCGLFTEIACASGTGTSLSLLPGATGLTVGNTYYVRIYSATNNPTGATWNYDICITNPGTGSSATIDYSKSYINVTKLSTGGGVEPGDILEIRATFVVRGGTVDSLAFYDTLQSNSGFTLLSSSIAQRTNEGKIYRRDSPVKSEFTDAPGDDEGWYSVVGADTVIQINIGIGANASARGRLLSNSRPSVYGSTCIIMATYRVQVYAGYDQKINWGGGAFTYKDGANMKSVSFKNDSLVVYVSPGLCSSSLSSINQVGIETNGTFGAPVNPSPLARNRGTSAAVPSYNYKIFGTGIGPNDYYYGIPNNTSAAYSTINTLPKATVGSSVPERVFSHWDIIGDHTGATNTAKGNAPCDTTQPVSATNPCGYMLVVNAAYKTDTAFKSTITNLCPNTYYEISAWVRNVCYKCGCDSTGKGAAATDVATAPAYVPFAANDSSGVPPNLAFQINGQDYYTTGNIYYTGTGPGITQRASDSVNAWVKRGFVYKTEANQTGFEFLIRNNAPGGGGNDWAIDDIVVSTCLPNMTYSPSLAPTICDSNALVINDTIKSIYENYTNYKWQRSTNGGSSWSDVTAALGPATPFWNGSAWEYVASYTIPPAHTSIADSADMYRMIVATTTSNLGSGSCQFTEAVNIITLDVIDCNIPLKTDLLSFSGKLTNEKAQLFWSTSREDERIKFEIEKSFDGINFSSISSLAGYYNPQAEKNYYSFTDPALITGKVWYRLVMANTNNKKKYTRIIQLSNLKSEFNLSSVINPFSDELVFTIETTGETKVEVSLTDMFGKIMLRQNYVAYPGTHSLSLNSTGHLPPGFYVLQVKSKENILTRKVIKK